MYVSVVRHVWVGTAMCFVRALRQDESQVHYNVSRATTVSAPDGRSQESQRLKYRGSLSQRSCLLRATQVPMWDSHRWQRPCGWRRATAGTREYARHSSSNFRGSLFAKSSCLSKIWSNDRSRMLKQRVFFVNSSGSASNTADGRPSSNLGGRHPSSRAFAMFRSDLAVLQYF